MYQRASGQLHTFTIVNNTMINLRLQIPFWYDFMYNIMILESTLGIYSRVELLGHIVVLLLFFSEVPALFSVIAVWIDILI